MAQAPVYHTPRQWFDILPDEARKWQHIESVIRQTARGVSFREKIRTPVLEQDRPDCAWGGRAQPTSFPRKCSHFSGVDDQYVLRPEGYGTGSNVSFVQHRLEQRGGVQKLFYIGPDVPRRAAAEG